MELNKPGLAARQAAVTLLTRVFDDGRSLDGLLDTRHGPSSYRALSDADKALVRAIVTSVFRHKGEIDFALSHVLDRKPPKNARHLIHTLSVATAQILFLDIPDSAAVDIAVTALRDDKRSTRFTGLANAVLRRLSREKEEITTRQTDDEKAVSNMAPWLRKSLRKDYGRERLTNLCRQHMLEPMIDITVKSDPVDWSKKLNGIVLFGNSIRVWNTGRVETWEGYDAGEWWVQDAAASLPAHLLGDIKGKSVLDLCAAPGGKTAQLATLGADVTALEANESRLKRLADNMERLNLSVETQFGDLFEWEADREFDAVLLDAPCSSTGTIRRHPDVQWTKSPQIIEDLAALQKQMIQRAVAFLKPGGRLVFSNCSLNRTEGEDVYAQVLKEDFSLDADPVTEEDLFGLGDVITGQGTVRTLPSHLNTIEAPSDFPHKPEKLNGLDGFFAARFSKRKV